METFIRRKSDLKDIRKYHEESPSYFVEKGEYPVCFSKSEWEKIPEIGHGQQDVPALEKHQEHSLPWNHVSRVARAFTFQCPKQWDCLEQTKDSTVRHCSECNRDVHLALTEEDFRRYSIEKGCVAVCLVPPDNKVQISECSIWCAGLTLRISKSNT